MDRRQFVKRSLLTSGALLGGALPGCSSPKVLAHDGAAGVGQQLGPPKLGAPETEPSDAEAPVDAVESRLKKAVKLGMVKGNLSVMEKFQLLARLGYDGVELDSPSTLKRDEVLRARDASGLEIHGVVDSVHWAKPFSHADAKVRAEAVTALKTAIKDCKAYGGSTVLVVPAVVSRDVPYDVAYERSQTEIKKALPLAEEHGIKLAFENVWNKFLMSPLEAVQYVDSFQSSQVGWYFDVGNVVHFGWPEQWVSILNKRILKLDIKEFSRQKRDAEGLWKGFDVKIGDGDCNWPAVMAALDEIGYAGWATAEVSGGDEARLKDIAERMDRVLARGGKR